MDDLNILYYVAAAIIYIITRARKKKAGTSAPSPTPQETTSTQRPTPKSFEELLQEITEGRVGEKDLTSKGEPEKEPEKAVTDDAIRLEGERRVFADEESRRIYEESIKQAEGFDLPFEQSEHFKDEKAISTSLNKQRTATLAQDIKNGLTSQDAKKAVIYAEILNRRY